MTRWLYPWPKTRCIERCRGRALQVQVQDVQNRRHWSSALLDEACFVLCVRRILMLADAMNSCWRDNLLPWCCMQGHHSSGWACSVQEPTNQLGTPSTRTGLGWHYNMDTTGIPAEYTQSVFQLECEWRCETESTIIAYRKIRRPFAGLDAYGSGAQ